MKIFFIVFLGLSMNAIAEIKLNLIGGPYESGQVFVDCQFDGITRSCHLDTGATATFLQEDVETNKLIKIGTQEFKTAADAVMSCDKVQIRDLRALGRNLSDHVVVRCPAPMKFTAGMDLIKNSKLYFDFKNAILSSFNELPSASKAFELNIFEKGLFTVETIIANEKLPGIWDTGAGLTSASRDFVSKHPDAFEFIQSLDDGGDTSGNSIKADLYRLDRLEVGGQSLEKLSVLVFDFAPIKQKMGLNVELIIGYNALILRNWHIDLMNKKFVIE